MTFLWLEGSWQSFRSAHWGLEFTIEQCLAPNFIGLKFAAKVDSTRPLRQRVDFLNLQQHTSWYVETINYLAR